MTLPLTLTNPTASGRFRLEAPPYSDVQVPGGVTWATLEVGEPYYGSDLVHAVTRGSLVGAKFVCVDLLLASDYFVTFALVLETADKRSVASFGFSTLTQCQTRVWFPIGGVDLVDVERVIVRVLRAPGFPARVCLWPITFSGDEPSRLETPLLLKGPLVDEFGQSTLHPRRGRFTSESQLVEHLRALDARAEERTQPESFSRWGGWRERRVHATGFFRTHHDGHRWWLVDPEGHLFWSSGLDCVHPSIDHETHYQTRQMNLRPAMKWMPDPAGPYGKAYHTNPYHHRDNHEFNFVESNFMRAFGAEEWHAKWARVTASEVRGLGFNSAADWSDEPAMSRQGIPYVVPLDLHFVFPSVRKVTGTFPDVFDPRIESDAAKLAEALRPFAHDPAMIGYFLTNEPSVGWEIDEDRGLAAAMLAKTPDCRSRGVLADFLRARYGSGEQLARAWGVAVTLEQVASGDWKQALTQAAHKDLTEFSTVMLDRLLHVTGDACRRVAPNHLNLGIRLWTFPRAWMLRAMRRLDVISYNGYTAKLGFLPYGKAEPEPDIQALVTAMNRPFMIGEWQFGALDGGLPSAGLLRVRDQDERGKAFRVYLEHAASLPWCVGAHWFNLYDRNVLSGAASNENQNIGFMDLCHIEHGPICRAARTSHERLYAVASGQLPPYDAPVDFRFPSR